MCSYISLALDESVDICDTARLCLFIRATDKNFYVTKELIGLVPLHGTTKGTDIFEKIKLCIENYNLDWKQLDNLCTDSTTSYGW
jgi:hypothetical protein